MSSELVLFEAVAAGAIETLFDDQNKPWFKRADLGRYLGIVDIRHMFKGIKTTSRLEIMGGAQNPFLGKRKNPHYAFVNLDGALEIAVRSRKPKAVALVKWLTKKGVEKLQKDHQKAIEERDTRIQTIEYENVGLQGEIRNARRTITDLIANRHVPRSGAIDTVLVVVEKNADDDTKEHEKAKNFDKYMLRCQKKQVDGRISVLRAKYPNMVVLEPKCDDGNAIYVWNHFKQRVLTKENYYRNHFRLPPDAEELFEDMFGILL